MTRFIRLDNVYFIDILGKVILLKRTLSRRRWLGSEHRHIPSDGAARIRQSGQTGTVV